MIYWFTARFDTGCYHGRLPRRVLKANIKLEGVEKASVEDSKKVVENLHEICAEGYAEHLIAVSSPAGVLAPRTFFFIDT